MELDLLYFVSLQQVAPLLYRPDLIQSLIDMAMLYGIISKDKTLGTINPIHR
ncbi:hypothetical protein M1146_07135 [Patescibacteria group bacterium]|nr:hypothetical protein [Patescibacteria group bacterium]